MYNFILPHVTHWVIWMSVEQNCLSQFSFTFGAAELFVTSKRKKDGSKLFLLLTEYRFISKVFPSHSPAKWLPTPDSLRQTARWLLHVTQLCGTYRHLSAPVGTYWQWFCLLIFNRPCCVLLCTILVLQLRFLGYQTFTNKPQPITWRNNWYEARQTFSWVQTAQEDDTITSSTWGKAPFFSAIQNFRHYFDLFRHLQAKSPSSGLESLRLRGFF
jgi:hypothetical protein